MLWCPENPFRGLVLRCVLGSEESFPAERIIAGRRSGLGYSLPLLSVSEHQGQSLETDDGRSLDPYRLCTLDHRSTVRRPGTPTTGQPCESCGACSVESREFQPSTKERKGIKRGRNTGRNLQIHFSWIVASFSSLPFPFLSFLAVAGWTGVSLL